MRRYFMRGFIVTVLILAAISCLADTRQYTQIASDGTTWLVTEEDRCGFYKSIITHHDTVLCFFKAMGNWQEDVWVACDGTRIGKLEKKNDEWSGELEVPDPEKCMLEDTAGNKQELKRVDEDDQMICKKVDRKEISRGRRLSPKR
jgi:hypothetical protein